MKVLEAAEYMSTMFLERIVKSFAGDFPKRDEEAYKNELKNNQELLADPAHVKERFETVFNKADDPYSEQLLLKFLLRSLLGKPDNWGNEDDLVNDVLEAEKQILADAQEQESFKHLDKEAYDVFRAVLEVALEDQVITRDEMRLLEKLRSKLSINEKDQFLIQANLELFPAPGNELHTRKSIKEGLDDLQKAGVVFHCNRPENNKDPFYIIPEEIAPALRDILGHEMMENKYGLLLNRLKQNDLKTILKSANFLTSGSKDEQIERIIRVGIQPSQALNTLNNEDLEDFCDKLPGIKKSGSKEDRINRIIDYFNNLEIKDTSKEATDPRMSYYDYFEQLAKRDMQNLLPNGVVQKDRDIDNAFEEATRYLFEHKFNLELLQMEGSEHCDGCTRFNDQGELFLWDNKSKLETDHYKFPDKHFRQFRRYIRNEQQDGNRVTCFLIVAPSIDPEAENNAIKLKSESGVDCDVSLISAEDLKMVAENWAKRSDQAYFDLNVFKTTGILDRETLHKRMKVFLG
jgi:hypothetical protein